MTRVLLVAAAAFWSARVCAAPGAAAIDVTMSPALELIAVVQRLGADAHPYDRFVVHEDIPFVRDVPRRFAAFKDHPAVPLTAELDARGFDYIARGQVLAQLSDPPELTPLIPLSDWIVAKAGGAQKMQAWLGALRDFSRRSKFMTYYRGEAAACGPSLRALQAMVDSGRYAGRLEDYSGLPFESSYTVIASPYYKPTVGVNSVIPQEAGGYRIFSIVGPVGVKDGRPDYSWVDALSGQIWHEMSHTQLDALAILYREDIAREKALFRRLDISCYDDWNQCVKEHLVRAVKIRLLARSEGDAVAQRDLRNELGWGFKFLPPLLDRLREYEADRKRYPTLVEFYPRFIAVFDETRRKEGLSAAATKDPAREHVDRIVHWASDLRTDGERRRAVRLLDAALKTDPRPRLRLQRGMLEQLTGDSAQAAQDAAQVLSVEPRQPDALLLQGAAWASLGRQDPAAGPYAMLSRLCRAAAAPPPACFDDRLRAAAPNGAPAADADAAEQLRRLTVRISSAPDADALYDRGVLRFASADAMGALADLDRAQALRPGDAKIALGRGVVLQNVGRSGEALAGYTQALGECAPGDSGLKAEILSSRASLLTALGRKREARADLEQALAVAPSDWPRRQESLASLSHLGAAAPAAAQESR